MTYMAAHDRIRRVRGSARNYSCACGSPAEQWAYNNASAEEQIDPRGGRYSWNFDDYTPMCLRCHRRLDSAHITHCPKGHPYSGANLIDAGTRKCRTCVNARRRTPERRARTAELQRRRRAAKRAAAQGESS